MENGFLADATYGGVKPSAWVEGDPETSFWTGTRTGGKRQLSVRALRCVECGYLDLYAPGQRP